MFQHPDYIENVSMRLSEVLDDIGVDERIVLKRRRWLLAESIQTRLRQLQGCCSVFFFGSQSEGTTTMGLLSDTDRLSCHNVFNVIQDWSDWEPGVSSLLMIQDETVSSGYCLLQPLRDDAPLPYNDVPNKYFCRDQTGRILLRNIITSSAAANVNGQGERHGPAANVNGQGERHGPAANVNGQGERHGPAASVYGQGERHGPAASVYGQGQRHGPAYTEQGGPGSTDADFVGAFHCKSWSQQVIQWPSDDIRRYCSNTGCFVVGVGSKGSENEELEWRISTSLAERCLMFNLNITQIRCYILAKMTLKTFFKQPQFENTISSSMCKTVLFHCIANTHCNIWRENNLLVCLSLHLFVLYNSVLNEYCPHFIIPGNNLMRGKISPIAKPYILGILWYIINSKGTTLLRVKCDDLGLRLQLKMNSLCSFKVSDLVSGDLLKGTALFIDVSTKYCLYPVRNSSYKEAIQTVLKFIFGLVINFNQCQGVNKTACCLLAPQLCTTLGSVLASFNIQQYNATSAEALTWISLGLNTDVSSSKLKLASMFYCLGDIQKTDTVLRDIEGNYDVNIVEPVCCCHNYVHQLTRRGFNAVSDNHNEEAIQYNTAFCIQFLQCEINCIPTELQYEMLRSTQGDLAFRGINEDWMDCAVVDSLPYLYFLQYNNYSRFERQDKIQEALCNLIWTIDQEPNLGHRETALNLLGQCMEQEHRVRDAFSCYLTSLNLRERNNAAKIHICRLLSNIINNQ